MRRARKLGFPLPESKLVCGAMATRPFAGSNFHHVSFGVRSMIHSGESVDVLNSSRQVKLPFHGMFPEGFAATPFGVFTAKGTRAPFGKMTGQPSSVHFTGSRNVSRPIGENLPS